VARVVQGRAGSCPGTWCTNREFRIAWAGCTRLLFGVASAKVSGNPAASWKRFQKKGMAVKTHSAQSRRILISGGGSGIGAGLAALLGDAGHHIIVTDVDLAAARRVAAEIENHGGSATSLALDVTVPAQVDAAIGRVERIDVLINNAGIQHVARLEEFPAAKWHLLVAVMLSGAADLTRAVLPKMRSRGFGRIINIGSIHSLVGSHYKSAYAAAKHGLIGFSKTIALETADVDVTVNTICPAYVRTPLVDKQIAAQAREHGLAEERVINEIMLKPMPKGVFITIEEIAGLTQYLMSDAARNVTAQAIAIDGGWAAQ
jgi:3-hydroxybutyrate dehydrogenase